MPYFPPETCVVPNVDRGISFTWNCLSTKFHELVVECVGFTQQIWLLDQPRSKHGRTLPM
jgi:hypothetical protein